MKTKSFLLLVLMIAAAITTLAQGKKDIAADLTSCTTARDSIQNLYTQLSASHEMLTKSFDSLSRVSVAYDSMYAAIKEKVIQHDFNPGNTASLIDSLKMSRDTFTTEMNDTISDLKGENTQLKATIETMKAESQDNTKTINDLKQLKELLDSQIITQEEFDAKKAKLLESF